jgi:molecular chaperone DnaK (HSP70)
MNKPETIVGIDLGTTNSEVAAYREGRVQVLGRGNNRMLPSCVGFSPQGQLLVGQSARNQSLLFPERTVRSIKRKMGSQVPVEIAGRQFLPEEISAMILRELAEWVRESLGSLPPKAVITVPAYFSDAQRTATREAGRMAGLEVARILNEPTAASLAYGYGEGTRQTLMVYDLGGGTFDVSVVLMEGEVTEVLASHGNNQLGGDDFDQLIVNRLVEEFQRQHGVDLRNGHPAAMARLWWAAEAAKIKLSDEPYARIREEALAETGEKPLHLDWELSRTEYEGMIRPLLETTLECVSRALEDAKKKPRDLDAILLVGGSSRTPLVASLLTERTGLEPRQEVDPDLCVALGAGILASRLGGEQVDRILVDISPFSFGPSHLGPRGGVIYPYCYNPVIRRNTPLPVTKTKSYYTSTPFQTQVDIKVFQGEDEDALKNILVGEFTIDGLTSSPGLEEVLIRMALDIDGILHVSTIEKKTGKTAHITIAQALQAKSAEEIERARRHLEELYQGRAPEESPAAGKNLEEEDYEEDEVSVEALAGEAGVDSLPAPTGPASDPEWEAKVQQAHSLLERSRHCLERMHDEDKEEAIELNAAIESALTSKNQDSLARALRELGELLFFVEGK